MNFMEALTELVLVSAGTITDRLIGDNPQIGSKVQIPMGNFSVNGVGLVAGAVGVATPLFIKSNANKYIVHFTSGMFADAVGIFGQLPYMNSQVVEEVYEEQPVYENPMPQNPSQLSTKGPFLQKKLKLVQKRNVSTL